MAAAVAVLCQIYAWETQEENENQCSGLCSRQWQAAEIFSVPVKMLRYAYGSGNCQESHSQSFRTSTGLCHTRDDLTLLCWGQIGLNLLNSGYTNGHDHDGFSGSAGHVPSPSFVIVGHAIRAQHAIFQEAAGRHRKRRPRIGRHLKTDFCPAPSCSGALDAI